MCRRLTFLAAPHDISAYPTGADCSVDFTMTGRPDRNLQLRLGCTIRPSGMRFGAAERELRRSNLLSLKWDHVGQRPGLKSLPVYGCTPEVGREASELACFWGGGTPFFRQRARLRGLIRPKRQPKTSYVYDESRIRSHRKRFAGS